jgi:hypothetical protein
MDEHPDYQTIKISCHNAGGGEAVLEPHNSRPGMFRIPSPEMWGNMVRVTAGDRCGNQIMRDLRLPIMNSPPAVTTGTMNAMPPAPVSSPAAPPLNSNEHVANLDGNLGRSPETMPQSPSPPMPRQSEPAKLPFQDTTVTEVSPQKFGMPPPNAPAGRQILNTTHASLEYRVDKVGPSGIGKVEVWMTPDAGKTWQRLREDADRHSPAQIDLPGEGVYGISLVLTNGNGFGGAPPKPGDPPTAWIEVDTTPPFVQLRDVDPVTEGGTLTIRWNASDKNLGNTPVALYYRTQPDAAWEVLARDLQNTGSYRWTFPHSRGSQFFIGIEVTDRAGNLMRAELPNAVILDMTEPHATVVNVSGITVRPR